MKTRMSPKEALNNRLISKPAITGPAVALINPKFPHNVGGVLRACSCWGIEELWWNGDRIEQQMISRLPREERLRGFRDVELIHDDRLIKKINASNVTPVAVELRDKAEDLIEFEHPENALYMFGPEDGSLPKEVLANCHRFLCIPTAHCLNLAAAVNVILYDRRYKRHVSGVEPVHHINDVLNEDRGFYAVEIEGMRF